MIRKLGSGAAGEKEIAMRSLALAALAALSLSTAAAAAPSDAGRLVFDVTRNGEPFGQHTITVSGAGNGLRAQSRVALRATVGPLTVYRLEQTCSETWSNGVLAGLNCSTLKDGRRTQVRAESQNGRLRVVGAEGENFFPLGAFPTSWWTRPPVGSTTLIDTQTGEPMRVRVTRMGRETIEVGGRSVQADRFRVQGTLTADLWYDTQGRWVGCAFTARGQHVEYRLATPLSAAPA
jgi:opacity protein-like surface antigen